MSSDLSEDERREIFRLLATGQDVNESREMIAEVHGLTDEEVTEIEREGVANGWPPLWPRAAQSASPFPWGDRGRVPEACGGYVT